jgi:hypothetical protein
VRQRPAEAVFRRLGFLQARASWLIANTMLNDKYLEWGGFCLPGLRNRPFGCGEDACQPELSGDEECQ